MNRDTLTFKIAEGFYSSAKEINKVSLFQEEMRFFVFTLKNSNEVFDYLRSPFIDNKDKSALLKNNFKGLFSKEFFKFLDILIDKNELKDIEEIKNYYDSLADYDSNKIRGVIYSPFELSNEQISKIEDAFEKKLNQKVILKFEREDSLICGLRILLKDKVYEYSLDSRLEEIRLSLLNKIKEE